MPTELPPPGAPDVFYVVDLSGYVYRAYHALPPMMTSYGEPTHAVYGVTQMLLYLVKMQQPTYFAVALDPAEGMGFRKELFPAYKEGRSEKPEDLQPQIGRLTEVIEAYGIPVLRDDRVEADDLIATVAAQAHADGLKVVVVSADKDLLQLVREDLAVIVYDSMKEKVYGPPETEAKLGVPPRKVREYLALTGDSSDNIPGIKGVGPKTAVKLLRDKETLEDVYADVESIKGKLKDKVADARDEAFLSRRLVTLKDDCEVTWDRDSYRYGGLDEDRLRDLFTRLELHKLLTQLGEKEVEAPAIDRVADEAALAELVEAAKAKGHLALFTARGGAGPLDHDPVGVALALEERRGHYVPFAHRRLDAGPQLALDGVVAALKPLLEDPAFPLVLADVKNERLCWEELGVTLRGERFGATLASYLIDPERHGHTLEDIAQSELRRTLESFDAVTEKRGRKRLALDEVELERVMAYAGERACLALAAESRLTPRLEGQHLEGLLKDVELPLSRVLAQLERDGIRLDPAPLAVLSEEAVARMAELEEEAYAAAGHAFAINSPRALEAVLFDELELPVIKKTKTARSTDQSVLEELSPQHPLPALVLEHRTLAKLKSTYLDALPQAVHPRTGRIHSRFNQAVTATGRVSSSEPNLQNIPIRTDWGRRIRGAFVPQEGWRLMSADYSQIELRVLAHLSEDEALVDAFTSGADVHDRTARALFELDADAEVDRFQRNAAKTVNYAVIYGQTQWALARNLGIERSEAKRYIDAFFARYAGVAAFMERTVEDACKVGGVRTILGRWRALPDIRSRNRGQRGAAERMARNTPIQGSAADLLKVAMVKVADALEAHESRMLLTVHDELVFEIAPGEEEAVAAVCREHMEHAWELRVPLVVDVGVGPSWMEAH